jgi:phosphotriesterase-related protein
MKVQGLAGKVMTIRGPVSPQMLGAVLMHEHLYFDLAAMKEEGQTPPERFELLRDYCAPHLKQLHTYGCHTVVDCSAMPGRAEPKVYQMLAEASDCHIVLATGFYREAAPDESRPIGSGWLHRWLDPRVVSADINAIADLMIEEFENGIRGSSVRPGIIKLASTKPTMTTGEEKAFRAGALAQRRTGLCITTHAIELGTAEAQLDLLESAGVNPSRVILGHAQRHIVETPWVVRRCMDRGAVFLPTNLRMDREFDYIRRLVNGIRRLFDGGYGDRLVLGLDWSFCNTAGPFIPCSFMPPPPYVYLFQYALPRMRELGLEEGAIEQMLVQNPARLLPIQNTN